MTDPTTPPPETAEPTEGELRLEAAAKALEGFDDFLLILTGMVAKMVRDGWALDIARSIVGMYVIGNMAAAMRSEDKP